jgi:Mrp family chromosome partitioning ATPase
MFPGIIENMAYFTPEELPDKVLLFGKKEQKLSRRFRSPILEEYLLYNPYAKPEITVVLQRCKQHLQGEHFR